AVGPRLGLDAVAARLACRTEPGIGRHGAIARTVRWGRLAGNACHDHSTLVAPPHDYRTIGRERARICSVIPPVERGGCSCRAPCEGSTATLGSHSPPSNCYANDEFNLAMIHAQHRQSETDRHLVLRGLLHRRGWGDRRLARWTHPRPAG